MIDEFLCRRVKVSSYLVETISSSQRPFSTSSGDRDRETGEREEPQIDRTTRHRECNLGR